MARCSPLPGAPGRLAEKSGTNLGALPGPCDSERETVRIELLALLFRRLHLQSPIQAHTSASKCEPGVGSFDPPAVRSTV